jgi:hypothetical protein
MNRELIKLQDQIQPYREDLLKHSLYSRLVSLDEIRVFTEQHVFAVWDFMSLLKSLQRNLTSVDLPWRPVGNPATRRLINEIVWGEESDVDENGSVASHFELYISAMNQFGADTNKIIDFTNRCHEIGLKHSLDSIDISDNTKDFVRFTFKCIEENKPHKLAALFTFGREDLIPDMFIEIVRNVEYQTGNSLSKLIYYLERHIEVDGGEHGPLALNMIQELCGNDVQKWEEATSISIEALKMRAHLWDGVLNEIEKLQVNN